MARLPLKTRARVQGFRALVAKIQNDPALRAIVRTWRVWDGTKNEGTDPVAAELPWVRLTPVWGASRRFALTGYGRSSTESPFVLRVETAVRTTDLDDSANLWDAIEAALFSQDVATRQAADAALTAAGISDVEVTQPAIVVNRSNEVTRAEGSLLITQYVDT